MTELNKRNYRAFSKLRVISNNQTTGRLFATRHGMNGDQARFISTARGMAGMRQGDVVVVGTLRVELEDQLQKQIFGSNLRVARVNNLDDEVKFG